MVVICSDALLYDMRTKQVRCALFSFLRITLYSNKDRFWEIYADMFSPYCCLFNCCERVARKLHWNGPRDKLEAINDSVWKYENIKSSDPYCSYKQLLWIAFSPPGILQKFYRVLNKYADRLAPQLLPKIRLLSFQKEKWFDAYQQLLPVSHLAWVTSLFSFVSGALSRDSLHCSRKHYCTISAPPGWK